MSNIAWPDGEDEKAAELLVTHGVEGVEIAPPKVFPDPMAASPGEIKRHRAFWESRSIQVVALQALLYRKPDLVLFGDDTVREALLDHLVGMMRIGETLGARILVLGAPGCRRLLGRPPKEASSIATEFLRRAGQAACEHGVQLCIEPNPAHYGCEFVTNSKEGRDLVRSVASPGICLHLDAAAMHLAGEAFEGALAPDPLPAHIHASEPDLATLGTGAVDHETLSKVLRARGYRGWVSVEMRAPATDPLGAVSATLAFAQRVYGSNTNVSS